MVKSIVLFEVRTEFLNYIKTRVGFRRLNEESRRAFDKEVQRIQFGLTREQIGESRKLDNEDLYNLYTSPIFLR
jgi:hypothetical protein